MKFPDFIKSIENTPLKIKTKKKHENTTELELIPTKNDTFKFTLLRLKKAINNLSGYVPFNQWIITKTHHQKTIILNLKDNGQILYDAIQVPHKFYQIK